jgi:hypothetical protein
MIHLLIINFARELVRPPYNLNLKKKRKKGTPPWYVKVGGHPMESVSHGLREEKGGEECQSFIKEHHCAKFSKNSEPLSLI